MPSLTWSQSIAAGGVLDVLDFLGWMYRYVPYPAVIEVIDNTTATGIVVSRTFGSDTIQQESVLTAGGTAAVIPSRLNVEPITEKAQQTDLIRIVYRNTSAGALTVNGIIQLTRMTA